MWTSGAESAVPLVARYENLLVVQTFSKSRSMAGARLGYAIGCPALIRDLATIQFSTNPYNVSRMALRAGGAGPAEQAYFDDNCRKIQETRAYTKAALEALGFFCTDSRATSSSHGTHGWRGRPSTGGLKERGVLVRWFDSPRIRDFNRSPSAPGPQMDLLLEKVRGTAVRRADIARKTAETDIALALDLDGRGESRIESGRGLFGPYADPPGPARRAGSGPHLPGGYLGGRPTTAWRTPASPWGDAVRQALGDKRGIRRYASLCLPMDEALVLCALDVSGRGGGAMGRWTSRARRSGPSTPSWCGSS